jgi:hypothetical protein
MCEAGRDRDGRSDVVEYCDSRARDAWERGRWALVRRVADGGDVINGGRGGWSGFDIGEVTPGDVTGEVVGDTTAVILATWMSLCRLSKQVV